MQQNAYFVSCDVPMMFLYFSYNFPSCAWEGSDDVPVARWHDAPGVWLATDPQVQGCNSQEMKMPAHVGFKVAPHQGCPMCDMRCALVR